MSSGFRKEGDMPRLDTLKGFLEERLRQAEARAQDHDMQMEELVEEFNETESPSPKERHRFELERGLLASQLEKAKGALAESQEGERT
jgi:hypothetical protein